MLFRCNFNLEAWMDGVEIEAASEEEAIEKLNAMTIDEMYANCGDDKAIEISEVDAEVIEADYDIQVESVDYDITEDDVEFATSDVEEEIANLKADLPQKFQFTVKDCSEEDLDDIIADMISDATGYLVNFAEYEIIKKY